MVHYYLSRHFFVLGNDPQRAHKCSESIFLLLLITSLKQQSNHKEYHSALPVGSTAQWLSLCSEKVFLKQGRCSINFHFRDFQRLHVSFPVVQFPYQKICRVLNLHHLAHRREDPECFFTKRRQQRSRCHIPNRSLGFHICSVQVISGDLQQLPVFFLTGGNAYFKVSWLFIFFFAK